MAFQPVPDGVEVVFHATQNGVPIVNVFHVKDTETLDEDRLEAIADVFGSWWFTSIRPIQSSSYVLHDITVTALEASTGPQFILTLVTDNQGALTGEQVAGNAAAVISWRTASIGRSYRGRTYIGGLDAAGTLNAQTLESTFTAALSAAASDLIDALETIGAVLSVLSRVADGVARVAGVLTEIITIIVDNKIDSQRKRTAN